MGHSKQMFQVFVSHSSMDTWVAKQIANKIKRCGARYFLDEADLARGDDFEKEIRLAAKVSREMIVLLTPWALSRPFIWLEIGAFWGSGKRIVGVLHGLSPKDAGSSNKLPIVIKKTNLLVLNEIDSYFLQLRRRVLEWNKSHE